METRLGNKQTNSLKRKVTKNQQRNSSYLNVFAFFQTSGQQLTIVVGRVSQINSINVVPLFWYQRMRACSNCQHCSTSIFCIHILSYGLTISETNPSIEYPVPAIPHLFLFLFLHLPNEINSIHFNNQRQTSK